MILFDAYIYNTVIYGDFLYVLSYLSKEGTMASIVVLRKSDY